MALVLISRVHADAVMVGDTPQGLALNHGVPRARRRRLRLLLGADLGDDGLPVGARLSTSHEQQRRRDESPHRSSLIAANPAIKRTVNTDTARLKRVSIHSLIDGPNF